MRLLPILLLFVVSLFGFAPDGDPIDDRAYFLSEKERLTYRQFTEELRNKTGFSLYLYTAASRISNVKLLADSLCRDEMGNDTLRAVILIDSSAHSRYISISPAASRFVSENVAERLAQKYLLPEFRKDRFGHGILVFAAELSKNVARLHDVKLATPLPRPSKDGIPAIAWLLIAAVFILVVGAYIYFVRQGSRVQKRQAIRDFGKFPHQKFDSGFER